MVCMGLRESKRFYTKKVQPPNPSPPHLPRAHKIAPKCVPTIHEESSSSSLIRLDLSSYYNCLTIHVVSCELALLPRGRLATIYLSLNRSLWA